VNREVHYDLTRRWALEEGFSAEEAQAIAAADWACDERYITTLRDKRYHWPIFGSPVVAFRRSRAAIATGDLELLGEALHALQDTIGHGVHGHVWHWPGIDRLENRSTWFARRLERRSRAMLAGYRRKRAVAEAGGPTPAHGAPGSV
jgi:hypothetical protein